MAEDNKFGEGYEAIFGKKQPSGKSIRKPAGKKASAKKTTAAKASGKKK
jgi:hypothetical protein